MAEPLNPYYTKLLSDLHGGKDSIFEPARMESFDPKTLQGKVHGLRSKETKENVTILFPSFYMNSGIISFPVNGTIGISFVGPDDERYFFPAQYFLPTKTVDTNRIKTNSAPGQFDYLLGLENYEQGELLLRSLGQSQIFISNNGEIELLTKNLNRVALNDVDGSFELNIEQFKEFIGYSTWFKGTHEAANPEDVDLAEQHIYNIIYEETPDWNKHLITEGEVAQYESENASLKDVLSDVLKTQNHPKFIEQRINVYKSMLINDENRMEFTSEKIISTVDGKPLFSKESLYGTAAGDKQKNTRLRFERNISQDGAIEIKQLLDEQQKTVSIKSSVDGIEIELLSGASGKTKVTINDSDVFIRSGNNGRQYSFNQLINRINSISNHLDMSDL